MDGNSTLKIGNALQHKGGTVKEQILLPVRVIDIMLDINHPEIKKHGGYDAIGTIFYAEVHIKEGEDYPHTLRTAKPMFQFIKQYPLKNEIVMIMSSPGTNIYNTAAENASTYYLPNFNIWNHPHHNALPDMRYFGDDEETQRDYEMVGGGLVRTVNDEDTGIPLGDYFQEKLNIQPLLPFEGDTIVEGRFGNSIRLGANSSGSREKNAYSTVGDIGDPITIIRNGQSDFASTNGRGWEHNLEDVNDDHSSVYLCSNQKMPNIEVASTNWESWDTSRDELRVSLTEKDEFDNLTIGPTPQKIIVPEPLAPVESNATNYTDDYEEELATPEGMCTTCEEDELSIYEQLMAQDNFEENEFSWEEYDIPMHDEMVIDKESVEFDFGGAGPEEDDYGGDCAEKGADNAAFQSFKSAGENGATKEGSITSGDQTLQFRKTTNWRGTVNYMGTPFVGTTTHLKKFWRKTSSGMEVGNATTAGKNSAKTHLCVHTTAGHPSEDGYGSIFSHITKRDCDSSKPWSAGGYHWMVSPKGKFQQNYADDMTCSGIGSGGLGASNTNCIQINWIGGADSLDITASQCKGLRILCQVYVMRYPNIKIFGHNQVAQKSCPRWAVPHWLTKIGCPTKNILDGFKTWTTKKGKFVTLKGYQEGKYLTQAESVADKSGKWTTGYKAAFFS